MVKTLTDRFKIGMKKGEKLDLVTAVNGKDYETKFNEIYSGIQKDREDYEKLLNRYSDGDILKQEKKKTGFNNYIKRGIATLGLVSCLSACEPLVKTGDINVTVGDKNYQPKAELQVSPEYAKVGEEVSISASGTDENGVQDIKEYNLGIDENKNGLFELEEITTDNKPIQLKKSFSEPGEYNLYSKCVDKAGEFGEAEKKITIYASDLPTVDFSGLNKTLVDGRTKTITLPAPTDADTEGEILYNSVKSLDDKVSATLNGRELTLTAIPVSEETNYQLEFDFGTEQGGKNKATLEGKIENLCGISGRLGSNDTGEWTQGNVGIYDGDNEIKTITTNGDGTYNIQSDNPMEKVRIKGYSGNSFKVNYELDGKKDYSDFDLFFVEESPNFSKEDFKEYAKRISFDPLSIGEVGLLKNSSPGLKKVNWNGEYSDTATPFYGVVITYKDPLSERTTTEAERNAIENNIKYLGGREAEMQILVENENTSYEGEYYTIKHSNNQNLARHSWGSTTVVPEDSPLLWNEEGGYYADGNTRVFDNDGDGYIDKFDIVLSETYATNSNLIKHETEHGCGLVGHAYNESYSVGLPSIMGYDGGYVEKPQEADNSFRKIRDQKKYHVMMQLDDVLEI
jgi:hypothetical protein